MTLSATAAAPRGLDSGRAPGRPRDPGCDSAILESALDLLAEVGLSGLTMEAVATRARVGKATVYRRWSSKSALVADALARLPAEVDADPAGSVRDQLVDLLDATRRRAADSRTGQILPRLISESRDHPEIIAAYRERVLVPRRARVEAVLAAGISARVLRPDLSVGTVVDLLVGTVVYQQVVRDDGADRTRHDVELLVDTLLDGLLA